MSDDPRLARWIEQAASHQIEALAFLRRARDPAAGPLPIPRRRALLLRALEHLVGAQRLLEYARAAAPSPELETRLGQQLARLGATAEHAERLLHALDSRTEAEGG